MNTLLPFVLSIFLPGTGQFVLKKYFIGVIMIVIWLILGTLIPFIPFEYFYFGTMIWSLIDIYIRMEKISGRTKAVRYLIFSIVIAVIIIPAIFYLTTISFIKGGRFVKSEYFNSNQTKSEMLDVSNQLDIYYKHYKKYPADYNDFINSKPIWNDWRVDSWKNEYRYTQTDSTNYILTSSGKDGKFDTDDDLVRSSDKKTSN